METDTTLVRAYSVVELHAITEVGLHFAAVVSPGDTECHYAVGFDHTLDYTGFLKLRMLVVDFFHTHQHFPYSLQILLFTGVFHLQGVHDTVDVHFSDSLRYRDIG